MKNKNPTIKVYKERNSKIAGEIQFWDESEDKITHSITLSGPFQGVSHNVGGRYIGSMKFANNITLKEANEYAKAISSLINTSSSVTKSWREEN